MDASLMAKASQQGKTVTSLDKMWYLSAVVMNRQLLSRFEFCRKRMTQLTLVQSFPNSQEEDKLKKMAKQMKVAGLYYHMDLWQRGDLEAYKLWSLKADELTDHRTALWWEEQLKDKLANATESTSIAVGTLHCMGHYGLVNILLANGYKVEFLHGENAIELDKQSAGRSPNHLDDSNYLKDVQKVAKKLPMPVFEIFANWIGPKKPKSISERLFS